MFVDSTYSVSISFDIESFCSWPKWHTCIEYHHINNWYASLMYKVLIMSLIYFYKQVFNVFVHRNWSQWNPHITIPSSVSYILLLKQIKTGTLNNISLILSRQLNAGINFFLTGCDLGLINTIKISMVTHTVLWSYGFSTEFNLKLLPFVDSSLLKYKNTPQQHGNSRLKTIDQMRWRKHMI